MPLLRSPRRSSALDAAKGQRWLWLAGTACPKADKQWHILTGSLENRRAYGAPLAKPIARCKGPEENTRYRPCICHLTHPQHLPVMEATPQAILGVGIPRHPVAVRPALGEAQARPRRTCSIIDVSVCLSLGRAPLRSLQLTSSAPSLQKVVSTQSARITRAGQRPTCHIIDLSECARVRRLPC